MTKDRRSKVTGGGGRDALGGMMSSVVRTDLPPTAQKMLLAAQRVLARDGYEGLTLRRVAEEALESKSLVVYHFGHRANLEALLIDSLWHDVDMRFVDGLRRLPPETDVRVDALVDFHEGIAADSRLYQMYFALLPSVIGDRGVRRNVARIYDAYREDINVRCLRDTDLPPADVLPLSSLFLGVGEGLPLQTLMSPGDFDARPVFALLGELAKSHTGPTRVRSAAASELRSHSVGTPAWPVAADPRDGLPKPARKILKTAQRLLETRGLPALTLDAIAHGSGEPRSSVSYYFQSKQGLIDALFASILCRYLRAYQGLFVFRSGESESGWIPTATEIRRQMLGRTSPVRGLFFMLPAVLHDDALRQRANAFYASLRRSLAEHMEAATDLGPSRDLSALASFFIASLDGLAIQTLYDPVGFDPLASLEVLNSLMLGGVGRARTADAVTSARDKRATRGSEVTRTALEP